MKLPFKTKKGTERQELNTLQKKQQSYHYSSKRSNIDRLNERRQPSSDEVIPKNKLKLVPTFISMVLVIAGIFYLLHLSPSVIVDTSGPGEEFIGDRQAVKDAADQYMKSSLLNRSKLTFDSQEMQNRLSEEFPEFSSISVDTYTLRQRPVVKVEFATPTLLMSSDDRLYIISEKGRAIADITNTQYDNVNIDTLPLIQDLTNIEITSGSQALSSEQVDYIREINFQTDKSGLKVKKIELMPGGGEIRVYYSGKDYFVKYNFYEDPRVSSGMFLALAEDLEKRGDTPKEYIDVRVSERAFVR